MFSSSEYLRFYIDVVQRHGSFQGHDIAVLCVLAAEPERRFDVQEIANEMGTVYYVAWNAIKRLQLKGLVLGGRLTDSGRVAMRVDDDLANLTAPAPVAGLAELY